MKLFIAFFIFFVSELVLSVSHYHRHEDVSMYGLGAGSMDGDGASKTELICSCEEYDCSCTKECFCKIVSNPFSSAQRFRELQEEEGGSEEEENNSDKKKKPKKKNKLFRCGCDFTTSGLSLNPKTSGLDCECQTASCTCKKKCTCKDESSGGARFAEQRRDSLNEEENELEDKTTSSNANERLDKIHEAKLKVVH